MKQILRIILSVLILLSAVACSTSDIPPESSAGAEISSQEISSAVSSEQEISSEETVSEEKCEHEYKLYAYTGNCEDGGQVVNYECIKCPYKYKKSYVSAQHVYDNYLCLFCNQVSPDNCEKGLKKWVDKNGEKIGNSYWYTLKNETTNEEFIIKTHRYGEEWCQITYNVRVTSYPYTGRDSLTIKFYENGECELSFDGVSLVQTSTTKDQIHSKSQAEFTTGNGYPLGTIPDSKSTESALTHLGYLIEPYMGRIQKELLVPYMGVRFDQIGFPSYE